MRRNIFLVFALFSMSFLMAQNNRFSNDLKTRKLSYKHRTLKKKYQDDYYQQFYWVSQIEKLKSHKHLERMNVYPLYKVIAKIYPAIPTKELNEEEQKLREESALALDEYFKRKEYNHAIAKHNLDSYVDPSGKTYTEHVNPERVNELMKKKIYSATTYNTKTKEQKTYYVLLNYKKNRVESEFIDVIPDKEKNEKFYTELERILPNFKFPDFAPTIKKGDKRSKKDMDYYYITPFEVGNSNIVYRTKDFEKYELAKFKKNGAPWQDKPERRKRFNK